MPQHQCEKIQVINIKNFCMYCMTSAELNMSLRSVREITTKSPDIYRRTFILHVFRKKAQQTQVNFFLNKKSTPWFKVLEFTTDRLPSCKKLILPSLNAFMQISLQQSTCETLALPHALKKVWGRKTTSIFPCDGGCNKNKNWFHQTVKTSTSY